MTSHIGVFLFIEFPVALVAVQRDDVRFFSFQQCLDECFPGTNKSTVKGWMRSTGRRQTKTTLVERQFLKRNNLPRCRHVISEEDLRAILEYSKTRKKPKVKSNKHFVASLDTMTRNLERDSVKSKGDFETECSNSNITEVDDGLEPHKDFETENKRTSNYAYGNASIINESSSSEDDQFSLATVRESINPHGRESCASGKSGLSPTSSTDLPFIPPAPSVEKKRKVGNIGRLPVEYMHTDLKDSIESLKFFYNKLSDSTLKKCLERVSCFLNFVRVRYPELALEFSAVNNCDCVQAYINYKIEEQNVCVSTAVREISAIINLAKYVNREEINVESCEVMVRLESIHRRLGKKEKAYNLAKEAGPVKKQLLNKSIEVAPKKFGPGDVCAVLDSVSTCKENAKFFLGRIVKFSDDQDEVLLLEFRQINDSEPFYKAEVDSSWWEPVDAIVFPLDIVFDASRGAYELRSSASDIYRAVFG